MPATLAASIVDFLLNLVQGPVEQDPDNRVALEGLAFRTGNDGALEIAIRRLEATSLRLVSGRSMLEIGQLALHELLAVVRFEAGRARLCALQAGGAELSGVKAHGPLGGSQQGNGDLHALRGRAHAPAPRDAAAGQPLATRWSLAPLAAANGTLRAEIVDAHLLFDADVTVPIREGGIDFDEASVEHVGPDSRMGVSRLGLYVDAPNGRSYLYQFATALVGGVEYERRGALPGPWVASRGHLRLQEFAEGLLRQGGRRSGQGFTEQARLLFDRTALSGEVRLGDGTLAAPGMQADLFGRAEGRNVVRLHAEAVGRALTFEMPTLSLRQVASNSGGTRMRAAEITAAAMLRICVEDAQLRFAFELAQMKISGLRLDLHQAANA